MTEGATRRPRVGVLSTGDELVQRYAERSDRGEKFAHYRDIPSLEEDRILRSFLRLIDATQMRVGNESYAKENKSFGATTLRRRHAKIQRVGDQRADVSLEAQGRSRSGSKNTTRSPSRTATLWASSMACASRGGPRTD